MGARICNADLLRGNTSEMNFSMYTRALISWFMLFGASALGMAQTPPPSLPEGRTFRNFSGVCQSKGDVNLLSEFVGWDRNDISWSDIEPSQGQWDQAHLEKMGQEVLQLRAKGINFLPILCYSAPWAVDMAPRTLHFADGRRVEFIPAPEGGAVTLRTFRKDIHGEWKIDSEKTVKNHPLSQLSAEFVFAWEAYVRRVVTFFSSPPYNLKYFQVWNEAHPESGFWRQGDNLDPYMTRVHLPAAKIIHELGGKVVYGGWPCCGGVQDYVALLDRHDAWRTIDVHDLHYFPMSSFEYLHRAAKKRGFGSVAIWQSEFGFTTNPSTIGNDYPRFLAWALSHDWDRPDKYKLFWFAAHSPDAATAYGYQCMLQTGSSLSAHGLSLQTLARLLSPGELSLYDKTINTVPLLRAEVDELKSSLEAFIVGGKKIVIAVHLARSNYAKLLTDWNGDLHSIHINHSNPLFSMEMPELETAQIASIQRLDAVGNALALTPAPGRTLKVDIPMRDAKDSPSDKWLETSVTRTFFIEIVLK